MTPPKAKKTRSFKIRKRRIAHSFPLTAFKTIISIIFMQLQSVKCLTNRNPVKAQRMRTVKRGKRENHQNMTVIMEKTGRIIHHMVMVITDLTITTVGEALLQQIRVRRTRRLWMGRLWTGRLRRPILVI
jgi:hypothetical protein